MSKKIDDITTAVMAIGIVVGVMVVVVALRWAILTHTPCSFFSLAEAPVRCLDE